MAKKATKSERKVATKSADQDAPPKGMVTRRQLAENLTVHMQTITKWEREGMPIAKRGARGRPSFYDEAEVRAWRQEREEAALAGTGGLNPAQERARRERAQAVLAEQMYQIRMRDLLPRIEVERVWSGEIAAVRTLLMSMPVTLADQLHRAALAGVPAVEKVLEDAVHNVLMELANPERPTEAHP